MNYENFSAKKLHFCVFFYNFAPFLAKITMNQALFYNKLYTWYEQNHRILPWRETQDPYKIWISEIILQQTRVAQGMDYYHRITERFPDVESLAAATEDELMRYWQGLGYYSRARNMHAAAKQIVNGENGVIFPRTWEEIRQLKGVGDYTAGAIASFAYNMPYPALDGNVYRVLSRLYDSDVIFDTTAGKKHFHHLAEELLDHQQPRLFNSAIMEFGALYCTPTSPDCDECPLQEFCLAYTHHTVELLPLRKPRPTLRDRYLHYAIYLTEDRQTLLHQRMKKDIWQHLWEFPLTETEDADTIPAQSYPDCTPVRQLQLLHVLSHQRLHARYTIYKVKQLPTIADTITIELDDLDQYALSRLTLRALEGLGLKK